MEDGRGLHEDKKEHVELAEHSDREVDEVVDRKEDCVKEYLQHGNKKYHAETETHDFLMHFGKLTDTLADSDKERGRGKQCLSPTPPEEKENNPEDLINVFLTNLFRVKGNLEPIQFENSIGDKLNYLSGTDKKIMWNFMKNAEYLSDF